MNIPATTSTDTKLIDFLQQEFSLSHHSIAIAQRNVPQNPGLLPLVLWQYGLVTLDELDQIYDWLDTAMA